METIVFKGIDWFNRPIFRSTLHKKNFFGSISKLFSIGTLEEDVLKEVTEKDLSFFGNKFGCEPESSTPAKGITIKRKEI